MPLKKVLITGSSGTIGTRLCEKMLEDTYDITGLDRKPNKWSKKVNKITLIGNLLDSKFLSRIPTDFDLIIHLAANARVYNSVMNPNLAKENFDMLFNILEFLRINKIKRFIFASSREIYGKTSKMIHSENEANIQNCISPYAASKLGGEALIRAYQQCYNIHFIILRFSNVYGMYDESDRVIPLYIKRLRSDRSIIVYGEDKILDFTYIDDAVSGVIKGINKFENVKNNVFNIASGEGTSLKKVANLIQKKLESDNKIIFKESRVGEVDKFIANISKSKIKLKYRPKVDISEGIEKTLEWYRENT